MGLGSPDGALEAPDAAPQPGLPVWTRHPYCFRRLSDPLPHFPDEEPEGSDPLDTAWDEGPRPPGQPPPEKDVKRKLEFRSPKAQTGSLALAEEPERGPSGPGKWGRPSVLLPDPSPLDRENLNNNNSKRSCPEDFEVMVGARAAWGDCFQRLWGDATGQVQPDHRNSLLLSLTLSCLFSLYTHSRGWGWGSVWLEQ